MKDLNFSGMFADMNECLAEGHFLTSSDKAHPFDIVMMIPWGYDADVCSCLAI